MEDLCSNSFTEIMDEVMDEIEQSMIEEPIPEFGFTELIESLETNEELFLGDNIKLTLQDFYEMLREHPEYYT